MAKKKCSNCAYFKGNPKKCRGECHRNAPRPQVGFHGFDIGWPIVTEEDFCGDFEEKEGQTQNGT